MAKPECDKMVLAAGKSDYLIRLASDKKDYVLCINQGNGKAKNCKIFTGGTVILTSLLAISHVFAPLRATAHASLVLPMIVECRWVLAI